VIGRVLGRGSNPAGLLYYLFGKGKTCQHVSPHLVAGWRHPAWLEPPARPGGGRDFRHLTTLLTQPLARLGDRAPDKPVWHCAIRAAPGDPDLGDGAWMAIAEEIMHRTGLSRRGEEGRGVRWVAAHHGSNHIHIVAVLARQDGRRAALHNDYYRIGEALRAMEAEYGLVAVARSDRTAARRPGRPEAEKAGRKDRAEAPRVTLQRHAAAAAAAAGSEAEYFALLGQAGVLVRLRHSTRDPGQVTGYAIALDDDKNPDGEPVWYGGGKLAADLTLPKLRSRWDPARPGPGPEAAGPEAAWDQAASAAAAASDQLRAGPGPGPGAGDIAWAAADVLRAAAAVLGSPALRLAADAYDRAARAPWGRLPPPSPAGIQLRAAARLVATTAHVTQDRPLAHIAFLIRMITLLEAIAELRQAQQHLAQAGAARAAARQLHDATAPPGPPRPPQAGPPRAARPDHGPSAARLAAADFPAGPVTRLPARPAPGQARTARPAPRRRKGPSP
jgi:hypothetical protein